MATVWDQLYYSPRLKETVSGTGTGQVLNLSGSAAPSHLSLTAFWGAQQIPFEYLLENTDGTWEQGVGVYDGLSSPSRISRGVIYFSSNANAAITVAAGCTVSVVFGAKSAARPPYNTLVVFDDTTLSVTAEGNMEMYSGSSQDADTTTGVVLGVGGVSVSASNNGQSGSKPLAIGPGSAHAFCMDAVLESTVQGTAVRGGHQKVSRGVQVTTTTATTNNVDFRLRPATTSFFEVFVEARQTSGSAGTATDSAVFRIEGGIKTNTAGSTAALVGTAATASYKDAGAAAWTAVVSAVSGTPSLLRVACTGATNKNITWNVTVIQHDLAESV